MANSEFDAVIVGSGPNGLAAGITLQQAGLNVLIVESRQTIGGGLRSGQLTLPGFTHDICSAIHPLCVQSPFFSSLPLEKHGLEFIYPEVAAAHPFDSGDAAVLMGDVHETAQRLGSDCERYIRLMQPIVDEWPELIRDILAPLRFPKHPVEMVKFGLKALPSAAAQASKFSSRHLRGLWAGMAAHSIQPLSNLTTSAIGLVLLAAGHRGGWPLPKGGSQSIAGALASYFRSLGGKIETGFHVNSILDLPAAQAVILDLTPRQILEIAGERFSPLYRWRLKRYRYGMGVFKIDWALHGPTPFSDPLCRAAGTVHLGNTFEEIAASEEISARGGHAERPFVLFAQQSLFDDSRAPAGKHTAWAYCHVPNGSQRNMTEQIERQVERFAPGFRDLIIDRHTMTANEVEKYNPNYVGGDINGGVIDLGQLYTRPVAGISPYRTSAKGIYICSSSTPPGGGVHGMCGYHAAKTVLKDIFRAG